MTLTIRGRLFSCLAVLAVSIAALAAAAFIGQQQSKSAIETILQARMVPMAHLKEIGDLLQQGVVEAGHQVRNDDISIAEGAGTVRQSRAKIAEHWQAY